MKDNKKEEIINDLEKLEQIKNKKILNNMWFFTITILIYYLGIVFLASYTLNEGTILDTIVIISTIILVIVAFYTLKIEITTGYYDCKNCHHRFIPTNIFLAILTPHLITTRYLKCPKCNKYTWAKKVMSKK